DGYSIPTFGSGPVGIAVGPDQNIWFTEPAVNRIGKLDRSALPVATHLVVRTQPPATIVAGAGFGLTVTAVDATGFIVSDFSGTATVAPASNPGGATLGGTTTATANNGVVVFSQLTLDKPGTGYTLRVSGGSLAAATTGSFNVT